jgi:methylmalonyl-CoA mutase cobalamin-binding domain/chain
MQDPIRQLYDQLTSAILGLDAPGAVELARKILGAGDDPQRAIHEVIKPTADEVGLKFQREEYFLPQLMLAGQALEGAMDVFLEAAPTGGDVAKHGVVIGTVKGDVHTIGKNVVAMMLRTGGFDVHDLGTDVDIATFVREATEREADIIAMSSLLTTTLIYQRDVIEDLESRGLRDRFKVLVGGGPVTPEWAEEIGADGYGKDATEALAVARRIVGGP